MSLTVVLHQLTWHHYQVVFSQCPASISQISQCTRQKEAHPTLQAVLPQYISWHQRQAQNQRPASQALQSVQPRYQSSFFYQDKPHVSCQHSIHKGHIRAEVLSNTMFCGVQRDGKLKGGIAGICPPCPLCFSSGVSEHLL